jgi:3-deoxy-7-phosphoheptulonate synthase
MIVVMKADATAAEIAAVISKAAQVGASTHPIYGADHTVVALVGDLTRVERSIFDAMAGVQKTVRIQEPYKLAGRTSHPHKTIFSVGGVRIGGPEIAIMAGPCSVESREQILEIAHAVKEAGATVLRGGAFKPRTSPYSFQGLGEKGLQYLAEAREQTGLPIITEVMREEAVEMVCEYADILQIGARNMQNYGLLQAVGKVQKPVLLKRGISGEIKELLMCAEYILSNGNYNVMLCERGIRTYETATRNTFDLNAIPVLQRASHLPIVADSSHGTGDWELIPAMTKAAVAAGADAVMVEVHQNPDNALSDGDQSLKPEKFAQLVADLRRIAAAVDRSIATLPADARQSVNGHVQQTTVA